MALRLSPWPIPSDPCNLKLCLRPWELGLFRVDVDVPRDINNEGRREIELYYCDYVVLLSCCVSTSKCMLTFQNPAIRTGEWGVSVDRSPTTRDNMVGYQRRTTVPDNSRL